MTEDFFRSKKGIIAANNTAQSSLVPNALTIGTTIVNTITVAVGSNVSLNLTSVFIGNSTVNTVINSTTVSSFVLSGSVYVAQGTVGTDGQVLTSNGTTSSWQTPSAGVSVPGNNTEVIFNDQGALGTLSSFTFNKSLHQINLGNSTVNSIANTILVKVANSTGSANLTATALTIGTSVVNSTAYAAGANVTMNQTGMFFGNSTVNAMANSLVLWVRNPTANAFIEADDIWVSNATTTTSLGPEGLVCGDNVFLGVSTLSIGNTTANLLANSIIVTVANSSGRANLQPTQLAIGSSLITTTAIGVGANVFINSTLFSAGNTTANLISNSVMVSVSNSSGQANLQPTQLVVGTVLRNSTVNTTALFTGNSTVNAVINSTAFHMGNTTVNTQITSSSVTTPVIATSSLVAQGSLGTSGQVLTTSGSTVSWQTVSVTAGNGNVRIYTANATYTKSAGLKMIKATVVSGGEDGEGVSVGTGGFGGGSGGRAGAATIKWIQAADIGATETVRVNGGAGNAFFGTSAQHGHAQGAAHGSTASNGHINISGQVGGDGVGDASSGILSGSGGSTILGSGGPGRNTNGAGRDATGYGAGGGGACRTSSGSSDGGDGTPGVVILEEFF